MKMDELRVGNWIEEEYNHIRQWTTDDFVNYLNTDGEEISDKIQPITLTPEILEKCGFEKDDDDIPVLWDRKNSKENFTVVGLADNKYFIDVDPEEGHKPGQIYYLHQLQNSYFKVTDEELEYKQ